MAAPTLIPGSEVMHSGVYLVSHSNGHRPDTKFKFLAGLILPRCSCDGCCVSYTFLQTDSPVPEDGGD
jgi:hypothetical protein